jgi:methionine biosynthesis protein MetW
VGSSLVSLSSIDRSSKAVVYSAGEVSGYGHIFSLGLAGIHVVALHPWETKNFRSRYIKERYVVPDPVENHERYIEWLCAYGRRQEVKPVLFFTEDFYAYLGSIYRAELSDYFLYPFIEAEKLDIFFNKRSMFVEAEKAGITLPRTAFSPLSGDELSQWNLFPAVLKPLVSRFTFRDGRLVDSNKFPTLFHSKAVLASNGGELSRIAQSLAEHDIEYCVQEYVPGENYHIANVKFVSDLDNKIPSCFISRKIRQHPADFGTCTVSRSEYIPALHDLTERFCAVTNYVGPGGVEFKWHDKRREWHFIEINPRLDFWIGMSTLKDVNLPLQQYLLSTSQSMFSCRQKDGGRYWIHAPGDVAGFKWRKVKKEWRIGVLSFLRPYLYCNEAIFNLKDPVPGLLHVLPRLLPRRFVGALVRAIRYAFFQKAPLREFEGYDQYWVLRQHEGTTGTVYPRFSKAGQFIGTDETVLDYGCGSGAFLKFLSGQGYQNITGSDISLAAEFPKEIRFLGEDELNKAGQFDVVTMLQVAEHVQDAEALIQRLLKIGRKLIISIPNSGFWQHRLRFLFGRVPITDVVFHMKEHVRFWTVKDFVDLCRERNWVVLKVVPTVPGKSALAQWLPSLFARQVMFVLKPDGPDVP